MNNELEHQLQIAFNYGYEIGRLGGVDHKYKPNAEIAALEAYVARKQDERERHTIISTLNLLNGTKAHPGDPVTKVVAYLHTRLKDLSKEEE